MAKGLNPRQLEFCRQYVVDRNGTQAAIRAGYSKKTAGVQAAQLLAKLSIQEEVSRLTDEMVERTELDADWVLTNFKNIAERCMCAVPVMMRDENGDWVESGEYKFDSSGANKATEMVGKHLGMFVDKFQIDVSKIPDEQLRRILGIEDGG